MALSLEVRGFQDQQVILKRSLLLYGVPSNDSVMYATEHPVAVDDEGRAQMLPGRPVTIGALRQMEAMLNAQCAGEILPPNVLFNTGGMLAWWVPAGLRRVYFRTDYEGVGRQSVVVPHPALVFVVNGGSWHVFALGRNKRPDAGTMLYHAPYMNVWSDSLGRVCAGNVRIPAESIISKIAAWESSFFDSEFTHPNSGRRVVKCRDGVVGLTRQLVAGRWKRFPVSVLLPADVTVAQAIAKISEMDK